MNTFLPSLFQAAIQQYRTVLKYPGNENVTDPRTGQVRDPANLYTWSIGGEYTSGTNILGLVFFAGDSQSGRSQSVRARPSQLAMPRQ